MSTQWEVLVKPDGRIVTVYTDIVGLHELGTLDVQRVSHVEFHQEYQAWIVRLEHDIAPHIEDIEYQTFTSRHEAIEAEVAYLQLKLAQGEL